MSVAPWTDPAEIALFLRRAPELHLYALGDLDEEYWPHTRWYALRERETVREVALLYARGSPPVLHALTAGPPEGMRRLLAGMLPALPARLYAHLSPGCAEALAPRYALRARTDSRKMALRDSTRAGEVDTREVVPLAAGDAAEVEAFYRESHPGHWFEPWMLAGGHYRGVRREGRLVSAGGLHVFSARHRVAALGNIATHPAWRGQGFASRVTAGLCRALEGRADPIGLNVAAANAPAIRCYERLGFVPVADYEECWLEEK